MATPFKEITKSEFKDNYNVVKVLKDKESIMKQLKTFNPNNEVVAFATKKPHKVTLDDVIYEMRRGFNQINLRIDNLVTKNNLTE